MFNTHHNMVYSKRIWHPNITIDWMMELNFMRSKTHLTAAFQTEMLIYWSVRMKSSRDWIYDIDVEYTIGFIVNKHINGWQMRGVDERMRVCACLSLCECGYGFCFPLNWLNWKHCSGPEVGIYRAVLIRICITHQTKYSKYRVQSPAIE